MLGVLAYCHILLLGVKSSAISLNLMPYTTEVCIMGLLWRFSV